MIGCRSIQAFALTRRGNLHAHLKHHCLCLFMFGGAALLQHLLLLANSSAVGVAHGFVPHGTRAVPAPQQCGRTSFPPATVTTTMSLAQSSSWSAATSEGSEGDGQGETLDSRRREEGEEEEEEAKRLLKRARKLRKEAEAASSALLLQRQRRAGQRTGERSTTSSTAVTNQSAADGVVVAASSPFSLMPVSSDDASGVVDPGHHEYRLHVDIGREPGSWMDRRWGASGRRVEFTLDVRFTSRPWRHRNGDVDDTGASQYSPVAPPFGDDEVSRWWVGSGAAEYWALDAAPYARMRAGFDRMRCEGGAYRIDKNAPGRRGRSQEDGVIRFCVQVEGTADYGDVSIPPGYLYFSLPAFSCNLFRLSRKPGPVTVRQVGWNTGWRREESRIVGVFFATPFESR